MSERPDIDRLAGAVAFALDHLRYSNAQPALSKAWDAKKARVALDELVALARATEDMEGSPSYHWYYRAEAAEAQQAHQRLLREDAEARVAKLERERDFWQSAKDQEHRTRHAMEDEIAALRERVAELAETNRCMGEWLEESQARVVELEAAVEIAAALPSSPAAVRVAELEAALRKAWDQLEELAGLVEDGGRA